jgi:hypothetical protein
VRLPGPARAPGFPGRDMLERRSTDLFMFTFAHDPTPHSVDFVIGRGRIRGVARKTCCPGPRLARPVFDPGGDAASSPVPVLRPTPLVASPLRVPSVIPWSCAAQRVAFRSSCDEVGGQPSVARESNRPLPNRTGTFSCIRLSRHRIYIHFRSASSLSRAERLIRVTPFVWKPCVLSPLGRGLLRGLCRLGLYGL